MNHGEFYVSPSAPWTEPGFSPRGPCAGLNSQHISASGSHFPTFQSWFTFSCLPFRVCVCVFQEKCLCVLESIMCFLVKGSPSWTDECKSLLGSCRQPQEELLWKQRVRSVTITRKLWLTQRLSDQVTQHGIQRLAPEWKCSLEDIIRASDVFLMLP